MELNITRFFSDANPRDYSASMVELGDNAGAITWRAACSDAPFFNILNTGDKRHAFREFLLSSGGWSREEITSFKSNELNALCMQFIAGDMREAGLDGVDRFSESAWNDYEAMANIGHISSRLFRGNDTQIYYIVE